MIIRDGDALRASGRCSMDLGASAKQPLTETIGED